MHSIYLLLSLLTLTAVCYRIDEHNYLYINSSFSRETVSFSMCFHFEQPATLTFHSPLLVPTQNHTVVAQFSNQLQAVFTPPLDSQLIGYNNYDDGEYWFAIKHKVSSGQRKEGFEKIRLKVQIGNEVYQYILLSPLFVMPLNAFEIYPVNTLYQYQNSLLISYLYKLGEVDSYIFQRKGGHEYSIGEKAEWGFKKEGESIVYQRHKTKRTNSITISIKQQANRNQIIINPSNQDSANLQKFNNDKYSYNLQDLLQIATPLPIDKSFEL